MIAMQYKITLPNDYNMDIIRDRVKLNGSKTDGFDGLLFKAYLIIGQPLKKRYAPLYVWKNQTGMNKFIFDGFFDNILGSFGWQHIHIAVPLVVEAGKDFHRAKYVVAVENGIKSAEKMQRPAFTYEADDALGKLLVYNPDKWQYAAFYFYDALPEEMSHAGDVYEILHISV